MKSQKTTESKRNIPLRALLLLQFAVFIYSLNTICGKMASNEQPMSAAFIAWLFAEVAALGVYAIFWQQAIKKIELSVAYANKAVGLLWALLWSVLLFSDRVTWGKVVGLVLVIAGTIVMNIGASDDNAQEGGDTP